MEAMAIATITSRSVVPVLDRYFPDVAIFPLRPLPSKDSRAVSRYRPHPSFKVDDDPVHHPARVESHVTFALREGRPLMTTSLMRIIFRQVHEARLHDNRVLHVHHSHTDLVVRDVEFHDPVLIVRDCLFPDHGNVDRESLQQRFFPLFGGDIPVHRSEGDKYRDEQDDNEAARRG